MRHLYTLSSRVRTSVFIALGRYITSMTRGELKEALSRHHTAMYFVITAFSFTGRKVNDVRFAVLLRKLHPHCHYHQLARCRLVNTQRSYGHLYLIFVMIPTKKGKVDYVISQDFMTNCRYSSIVFSCWKKTLHLACELLRSHAIRYNIIDGSLSLSERRKVIGEFRSPTGANVLLMTLGTGAVG